MVKFVILRQAASFGLAAALTANAVALPVHEDAVSLVPRDDDRRFPLGGGHADEWCPSLNYNDPQARDDVWYGSAAGIVLDKFLDHVDDATNIGSEERKIGRGAEWFRHMVRDALGGEHMMHCDQIGDPVCVVDNQRDACKIMYDAGYGSEYWILKQVESLNALLKKLKDELVVEKGIEDILSLDKIAKDFKEPDDGVELGRVRSRVISALGAFTAAAGVANGGVGAASGMLGGIFGATEAKQEIGDKTKLDLQAAVLGTFKKLRSSLENIQNNALGRGDQKDLPAAAQTEDGVMTDTARFFAHGKWFIKANGDEVKNFIDKAKTWMTQSLVVLLLRSRDFEVLIWDDLDREQCLDLEKKSSLPVKTARWIPEVTESGCYILTDKRNGRVQQEAWGPMKASDSGPRTLDDEQYDKLIGDDYNVNMRDLYKNAIWCAATDEEEHSAADIFGEGSDKIPRCLFNLPVKRAKWVHKFHGDSYFEITKENFK